ncbi:FAD binding domain protein [Beauveria brongniartii RCEF 3172]|uniref:FAD binding domain protein n=1 Tax=Beauveria brongniartii RCEF 3172 TaxID=1081107 RepID=A0A166YDQ5_9HYPO|nr:FAD binding domain protein [Beauveria brongniartii RCEF 3172]
MAVLAETHYVADVPAQLPLVSEAAINGTDGQGCHLACESLAATTSLDLVVHHHRAGIPARFAFSFYAVQQRELIPLCVAEPLTAEGVAVAVRAVTKHRCRFAVKSGGHSNALGTNARQSGVVIDLGRLDQVEVGSGSGSSNGSSGTVFVGPGNCWGRVYGELEPRGLAVAGGRVDSVGVGGFTLGGGISFLSPRHGWAVDNVVLPNGTITNASVSVNPDLYFALRGGGSSFGIVTRFEFEAHSLERSTVFWGGTDVHLISRLGDTLRRLGIADRRERWWSLRGAHFAAVRYLHRILDLFNYGTSLEHLADGFTALAHRAPLPNENVGAYVFFGYMPGPRMYVAGSTYVASSSSRRPAAAADDDDMEEEEEPVSLRPLTSLPHVHTTRRGRGRALSDLTREVTAMNPTDKRQHWRTSTFRADAALLVRFWDVFMQESAALRYDVPDAMQSTNVQLVTAHEIALGQQNGGNAFGLRAEDGPLFLFVTTTAYAHAQDDEAVYAAAKRIHARLGVLGRAKGLDHPFIYPNYAAPGQDVFAGFAPERLERLLEIQSRYDAERVFANLQPEHLTLNDKRWRR